jgi:hypothetical protein
MDHQGLSPRKEATTTRKLGAFRRSKRPCICSHREKRVSVAGHARLLVKVTSTLTPSHLCRIQCASLELQSLDTYSSNPNPLERAAMDAIRKRKASNATPTNTDGSATKKIKLVVRVPLFYTLLRGIIAWADRVQAKGAYVSLCVLSDGGAGRCWCRWCCEREDKSATVRQPARESMGGIGLSRPNLTHGISVILR